MPTRCKNEWTASNTGAGCAARCRSARSWRASAHSLAPDSLQDLAPFLVQLGVVQQVRTLSQRGAQGLLAPPLADLFVVAGQEYVRHAKPTHLLRPRVVRVVEQPAEERVLFDRAGVADHPFH